MQSFSAVEKASMNKRMLGQSEWHCSRERGLAAASKEECRKYFVATSGGGDGGGGGSVNLSRRSEFDKSLTR